jgi:dimethylamine monooxygenase subunit A
MADRQPYFDGPPRFDVGLKPIALAHWLLPDDQAHWLGPKNALIDSQRDCVFEQHERSLPAQHELAELISQECGQALNSNEPPLLAASRLVSDDLIIMEQVDGHWTNTACCLCSPTFFSAGFAASKSLTALHKAVPDGDFGLAARIGRVFTNLADGVILERHNWTLQWSDARFTPDATAMRKGAEDADTRAARDQLFLRVERQTIRRLPKSRAILFTIRIRLSPLVRLLEDTLHCAAFARAWQDAPQIVRDYKRWSVLERHVAALLAER